MDKSYVELVIDKLVFLQNMTDETIMKASSQNKKRLMIAILLAVGFLFMSSTTIAMPLLSRAE